jgi:hypothetical protein
MRKEYVMSNKIVRLAGLAAVPVITLGGPVISGGNALASTQPSVQTSSHQFVRGLYQQDDFGRRARPERPAVVAAAAERIAAAKRAAEAARVEAASARRLATEQEAAEREAARVEAASARRLATEREAADREASAVRTAEIEREAAERIASAAG